MHSKLDGSRFHARENGINIGLADEGKLCITLRIPTTNSGNVGLSSSTICPVVFSMCTYVCRHVHENVGSWNVLDVITPRMETLKWKTLFCYLPNCERPESTHRVRMPVSSLLGGQNPAQEPFSFHSHLIPIHCHTLPVDELCWFRADN